MRIERVLLQTVGLRLRRPFRSAGGVTRDRTILLVHLEGEGVRGVAECVAGDTPHYTSETVHTARWVLENHLVPAVLGRRFESPRDAAEVLDGAARGHAMAKAAVEMAVWDAQARGRGVPLAELLGGVRADVPVGVSLGVGRDPGELLEEIEARLGEGYRRIKLKISPGRDRSVLDAVRRRFPGTPLTVDANATYRLPADSELLASLDEYDLLYIEQPLEADGLVEHAALRSLLSTPICLDESITSAGRCREAIALEGCDVVNLKPGRVGGHGPSRAIHDLCAAAGIPVWCGGMLESGIGRAHNLALASLENMRFPGDLSASDRYWERDVVVPPFTLDPGGTMRVPTGPGIGVELDEDFLRAIEIDRLELTAGSGA